AWPPLSEARPLPPHALPPLQWRVDANLPFRASAEAVRDLPPSPAASQQMTAEEGVECSWRSPADSLPLAAARSHDSPSQLWIQAHSRAWDSLRPSRSPARLSVAPRSP